MRLLNGFIVLAVGAAFMLGTSIARGQEKAEKKPAPKPAEIKPKESQPPAGESAEAEMMKQMMEAGAPGPQHEQLKYFVGNWKATVKSWMGGPGEPQVSDGTATVELLYGGRYIKESFKGTFMGMPFEGFGLAGYDNVTKKYVGTWCDNMSTSIAITEGTADPSGKVFTYNMTCSDPMTGKPSTSRAIKKITDDNSFTFTMYGPGPDGKEATMMEITYTRS